MQSQPLLAEFDWAAWKPGMQSTLVFVFRNDEVLLIHKKTGLGRNKVNAPGGKVEPGEDFVQCAEREVQEEVGLRTWDLREVAELRFLMNDHPDILCRVYVTRRFTGCPTETKEARPYWCSISEIPYDKMWEDDRLWLPRVLDGERIRGSFRFEGETMKSHWLEHITD